MRYVAIIPLLLLLSSCRPCCYRAMAGPTPEKKEEVVIQEEECTCLALDDPCGPCVIIRPGERDKLELYSPETLRRIDFGQGLTLGDVRTLSALGFSDELIMYQLNRTESSFQVTNQQRKQLEMWGIRPTLIEFLSS